MDLDRVWENIVAGLAGVQLRQGASLEEQLALAQQREKLQKEIAKLEKMAWAEKQPKKKYELAQELKALQERLTTLREV